MDIFKKYVLIVSIAIIALIIFVLFAPIDWDELKSPAQIRADKIRNCIDINGHLTLRECADLYPVDNWMTRPVINMTGWFDFKSPI